MSQDPKFYVYLSQEGGCDYTIGCGYTLIPLKSKIREEAMKELETLIAENYNDDTHMLSKVQLIDGHMSEIDVNEIYQRLNNAH